jgi:hypothetical protein
MQTSSDDAGHTATILLDEAQALVAEARRILAAAGAEAATSSSSRVVESTIDRPLGPRTARGVAAVDDIKVRRVDRRADEVTRDPVSPARHRTIPAVALGIAGVGLVAAGAGGLAVVTNRFGHSEPASARLSTLPPALPPAAQVAAIQNPVPGTLALPETDTAAPLAVTVPRLQATATVAGPVGVEASGPEAGLLTAPDDYHQLGWYRNAQSGALVIDGHVGYRQNPGPLAYIGNLVTGDTVQVSFPQGVQAFRVTLVGRAAKGQLAPQYFSPPYNGQVMLITCDYTSTFHAGHYADNVFVLASPA